MLKPKKSCKDAALSLLSRREHSSAELKRKLAQKGYDRGEIEKIIEYCGEFGYLSDGRFAAAFARELIERKLASDRAALAKLASRGASRGDAEEAVKTASELFPEELRVEALLAKWGVTPPDDDAGEEGDFTPDFAGWDDEEKGSEGREARKKIIAKLLRLGYSYEVVKKGLKVDERRR